MISRELLHPTDTELRLKKIRNSALAGIAIVVAASAIGHDLWIKQAGDLNLDTRPSTPPATEPQKAIVKTWATEEGEEMEVPEIFGLTPQVVKMSGRDAVVYFTKDDNPFGLEANIPGGLFDPDIDPKSLKKIGGVGLDPFIATHLRLDEKLPKTGKIFLIESNTIKDNLATNLSSEKDIETLFEPKASEGVEIYGGLRPITREQLPLLIDQIISKENSESSDIINESFITHREDYDLYPYNNQGKQMESYIKKREAESGNQVRVRTMILVGSDVDPKYLKKVYDKLAASKSNWYWSNPYKPFNPHILERGYDEIYYVPMNEYARTIRAK